MAPDYDRYLFSTDPGIDSLLIQKAYTEWSSYCYAAFTVCSSRDNSPVRTPSGSLEARQNIYPANKSNKAHVGHDDVGNDIAASGLPTYNHSSSHDEDVEYVSDSLDISFTDDTCVLRTRSLDNVECDYCNPEPRGDEMPRQPGYEFGTRLSWRHDAVQCHVETGRPARGRPALGVSGLKCQNVLNSSPKRTLETFPKCASAGRLLKSRSVSMGYQSTSASVVRCERFNGDLRELYHSVRSMESVTVQRTKIVTSRPISDVIEECSSSEEDSQQDVDVPASGDVVKERTRKVTFADEKGENLVRTRVFEREDSPVTFLDDPISEQKTDDVDADDEDGDSDGDVVDICPSGFNRNSFNIMADISVKVINRDIDNLKKLIHKHREYFDSIKPSPSSDSSGTSDSDSNTDAFRGHGDNANFAFDTNLIKHNAEDEIRDSPNCNFLNFNETTFMKVHENDNAVQLTDLKYDSQLGLLGQVSSRGANGNVQLFVRCSSDDWQSFEDFPGCTANDAVQSNDLSAFTFGITTNPASRVQTLEFAVCMRIADTCYEYWDNNDGQNYKLELCW